MKVSQVHRILGCGVAYVIGFTVRDPWLNAATCHPHGECIRIMITSNLSHFLTTTIFLHRRSPKFTTPNHKGIFQHIAVLKVHQGAVAGIAGMKRP
jgi:hypothetical protein